MTKIDDFFKELQFKKTYMEIVHEEYIEALRMNIDDNLWYSYKTNYNEITVSSSKKINGLEKIFQYTQEKEYEFKIAKKDFETEKKACMLIINKLQNKLYKLIIKYTYIDEYNNKEILNILEKYHRIVLSEDYFRKVKAKAVKAFEKVI